MMLGAGGVGVGSVGDVVIVARLCMCKLGHEPCAHALTWPLLCNVGRAWHQIAAKV